MAGFCRFDHGLQLFGGPDIQRQLLLSDDYTGHGYRRLIMNAKVEILLR